jgi:hypothetical protein
VSGDKSMGDPVQGRWQLAKDAVIFQVKLGLDAVRDLLLSPVSIVLAIWDVLKGHTQEQSYFYRLMQFGHKTDKWLSLFASPLDKKDEQIISGENTENYNVDQLLNKIESVLKAQHKQGGVASTKASIVKYLDNLLKKQ